jgi:HAE1 family hydrophobic/amphiphilic exporter-1/multidrug efflux pump
MRVWLKPDVMAKLGVTTSDVAAAIRVQNTQNAAGKIGAEPVPTASSSPTPSPPRAAC